METGKRRILINWDNTHGDLRRLVEEKEPQERAIGNDKGWSYVTFFPKGTKAHEILFDIGRLLKLAKENDYYLPREVVVQHNKVVVIAYPDGESPDSPLLGLYHLLNAYAKRFGDVRKYPSHGFYGKFGGIYERPEKGRALAVYSGSDDALLDIYESLEKLIGEAPCAGVRFELRLSNGLSAIPRMLHGFDDPEYRRSGAEYYRITDPDLFKVLLDQSRHDHERYPFDEGGRGEAQSSRSDRL